MQKNLKKVEELQDKGRAVINHDEQMTDYLETMGW